jgi:hypothetical protein
MIPHQVICSVFVFEAKYYVVHNHRESNDTIKLGSSISLYMLVMDDNLPEIHLI